MKPDDVSQEAWDAAVERESTIASSFDGPTVYDVTEAIAYAIMAAKAEEREACAKMAWDFGERYLSELISSRT